ncbi:MAG: CBS domain-containing protein [Halobacteriales archaeon]
MDIEDVVSTEYKTFEPGTRASKIKGFFQDSGDEAVVIEDDDYEGVVTRRMLISSHVNPDEKASSLVGNPPRVGRREDVRETARLMVESDFKVLPVKEGNRVIGVVTANDLLRDVNSQLNVLSVEDVYTQDLITVTPGTSVGRIINIFRENAVSRVPVVDGGNIAGIVSLYDILGFSVREETPDKGGGGTGEVRGSSGGDHGGFGPRHGDADRMLDIPAEDVMNSPVETTKTDEPLDEAMERMLDRDFSSLVVVGDDGGPAGIITKTDVLRSLTWTDESHMDVQISNVDFLEPMSADDVAEMLEEVADKYAEMQVLHAHVHLKRHKEKMRGNPLILARVVIYTNKGQFVVKGEGYGPRNALRIARDKLERRVLEAKGVRREDRDAERLFKEMGGYL